MEISNWKGLAPQSTYRRSIDHFFNDRYRRLVGMENEFTPAINVSEQEPYYVIEAATPGLKKEDLSIIVNNGMLTISGDRRSEEQKEKNGYILMEFNYSAINRSFTLPADVDDEQISATYEDGVLRIQLPREIGEEEKEAQRAIPIR